VPQFPIFSRAPWFAPGLALCAAMGCAQSTPLDPGFLSDGTAELHAAAPDEWPADCEEHYQFVSHGDAPDDKFSVPAGQEIHPQIMFTAPWTGDVQAVAFRPITDNAAVLHHWILYGGQYTFITGWAPGGDVNRGSLPPDVGMYIPSGSPLRLDVHYNNLTGTSDQLDGSGVEVCVIRSPEKFRPNTATVAAIIGNPTVPPHQRVDNSTTCTVSARPDGATLVAESPHMHLLGVHAKLELTQDGIGKVLHDAPFSFDQQHVSLIEPRVIVRSGDKMTVTCSFQNDTDRTVTFGENTDDEMCFNFVTVYPLDGFSCLPDNWSHP
jgi:hypothetical protein